jgi:hypothetical protein
MITPGRIVGMPALFIPGLDLAAAFLPAVGDTRFLRAAITDADLAS